MIIGARSQEMVENNKGGGNMKRILSELCRDNLVSIKDVPNKVMQREAKAGPKVFVLG